VLSSTPAKLLSAVHSSLLLLPAGQQQQHRSIEGSTTPRNVPSAAQALYTHQVEKG
jgi:hypothetical protein